MIHDIAIRGGLVVDGTGTAPFRADIGITDGRIAEIGERIAGRHELEATHRLVTPGFLDIHTHYDPQVLWDPALTPSSLQGVTGVVAGNCGYSIAPARPDSRASLLRTLDKVEDMRFATLEAGVAWNFETYPEYLKTIGQRGTLINFGGFVGHTAVRMYVMGDEAYERTATAAEITRMKHVVAESIRGGALGFSSDRAGFHLGDGGRPVPSVVASQDELEALLNVTREIGAGLVHVAAGENYDWLYDFQRALGRTITWTSILTYPGESAARAPYQRKLDDHLTGRRQGADVWVQVTCRPITQEFSISEPTSLYSLPAFSQVAGTPLERRAEIYADHAWRAEAWEQFQSGRWMNPRWEAMTVAASPSRPELVGESVATIALQWDRTALDVLCELALSDALSSRFRVTFANDDEAGVARLVQSDGCIMGLSDAGAHVNQMCDAVMPTDFLAHWVRDRNVLPVGEGVRKLTGEIADVLGIDRGYLRVGSPADVVVLDYESLSPGPIRSVSDLPANGERLIADSPVGLEHVLVNGVPIRENGRRIEEELTGMPGRIVHS